MSTDETKELAERLDRIEGLLASLAGRTLTKKAYTIAEAAEIVGRTKEQVRIWCAEGRVKATKKHGRGRGGEWIITAEELEEYRNYGLRSAAG